MATNTTDVIIIGAGLSGLTAARRLHKAGKSFVVLEARDRVGGKTLTDHTHGGVIELGAAWVNEHVQPRICALAKESGSEFVQQYVDGKNVFYADGQRQLSEGTPEDPLAPLHAKMEALAERIEPKLLCEDPALTDPEVLDLDAQTIYTWYRAQGATEEQIVLFLEPVLNALYGAGSMELSFLYHALGVRANGGWIAMVETNEKGAQYQRTSKGNEHMSKYLASLFPDSVKLNSPVHAVTQSDGSVTVKTPNTSYTGKAVIVTIGTVLLDTIDFTPPLPLQQRLAIERSFTGYYSKVVLFYKSAWWREKGFTGASFSPMPEESMQVTFDQVSGSANALTAFVVGQKGSAWAFDYTDETKGAAKVIEDVARVFGCDEAKHPVDVVVHQWTDEKWSRGAPGAFFGPGQIAIAGAFMKPTGCVYWAGTDNATDHIGYMEGAVQAGEARADDVLELLK